MSSREIYSQYGMFYVKYLILSNLLVVTPQLNLYYTDSVSTLEKQNELQHDCLRAVVYMSNSDQIREIIFYCMNEFSSKFNIKTFDFYAKLTFVDLAKENISSEQLYRWSAPIDLIEDYQFYLNHLSIENNSFLANKIFYNCTWPRFGPQCQYELDISSPDHLSTHDIIHHFYKTFEYNPINLACYEHLQCNYRLLSACLDWSEICDGKIDCLNAGIDEEHCWQLEFNQCKDDEYRCINGQCIPQSFYREDQFNFNCLDASDNSLSVAMTRKECHTSEPSFRCEDLICKDTPLTSSCISGRRNLLWETISSIKTNSTSEQCWSATKCLLKLAKSEEEICKNLCANNTCIDTVARSCPDILYIPNSPILFGHFYLAYVKPIEQNSTSKNIWMIYICYTMPYYDVFFHMASKITLNNRTCFFYQTISYLRIQIDAYSVYQSSLKESYNIFQKYHLIYNYNSTICNRSNMYQCINSSKCVSVYRLFDGIGDCPYMDDENMTAINNSHVIKQLEKTHFKCQTTNKYIPRSLVNNVNCDCNPNEYYYCDDEILNTFEPLLNISFQTICDGFIELLPIMINGQNHTDETECQQWQCNNIYTHCDGLWNCLNGKDEINCNLSSSSKCLKDHHLCISPHTNQFMCLSIEKINDGNVDCLGGSDEITLCRQKYTPHRQIRNFYCMNQTPELCTFPESLCDGQPDCMYADDEQFCETNQTLFPDVGLCNNFLSPLQSDVEKFLCHQMKSYSRMLNTYFTLDGMNKSVAYHPKYTENTVLSSVPDNIQVSPNQHQSHCQRGIRLYVWLNNHSTNYTCLCPQSYYGSQCQYQNQRISLTIRFRAFSDSYQTLFAIVISLIDDSDDRIIHSYEQITYLSFSHCKTKFNIYLLYSTRRKHLTKQYHIHIDFYEKISLVYRGSVLLPVTFPFLPVQRLVFLVDIPRITDRVPNSVTYRCVHGKRIRYSNNADIPIFCQCDSGWSGRYCKIEHTCNCGSGSVCLGISANNRSICVCPIHKFGPRCLLTNTICQNNTVCQNGGQCIPNDEYLMTKRNFTCLCQKGFIGDRCETNETKIVLSFDKNIVLPRSIFIHFIQVINTDFPVRSTTFRTIPFEQDSLTIYWSQPFHLVFIELGKNNYHLTVKQTIYDRLSMINKVIHPSDRCPHIREVLNETIIQWDLIRQIKYYHLPCQNRSLNLSCFYDNVHLCLCYDFQQQRLANCFNFVHNMTFNCLGQSVCENDGECLQDHPECPTRSICMCPPCFYGIRCQFSTSGFGLSLDAILGYDILPNVSLNHQPFIIKMSLALTIIFMIGGLLDSILSMMTFKNKVVREVGCGLYLLSSSITTLLIVIMFGLKFLILLLAQMTIISNRSFLLFQCHSIDFFLRVGLYMDQWLNACVATERAYTIIKGARFSKKKSKRTAKFVIILLVIVIAGTSIHDPISRDLIDEESNDDVDNVKRTWCIVNYGSILQFYNSMINTIHFFGPFMINMISTIILITKKSRQQANIHKQRAYKAILIEQLKQNKHLLTAPIVLVILALPRIIITFVSKCMKSNNDAWLFLVGYFISFVSPMLTFTVFILPSKFYQKEFHKSVVQFRTIIQQRLHQTS